jgi:hypothetical protein
MDNKESIGRLVEYVSKPLSGEHLAYLNTLNNVNVERVELFCDFSTSLSHLIVEYYLGDDVMLTENDKRSLFEWCWKKNIGNFGVEKLNFNLIGEHYYYYFNYFTDVFFENPEKNDLLFSKILSFWCAIFSLNKIKTRSEYDFFIEIYTILNKNFSNIA